MVPYIPERYFYLKSSTNDEINGPFALGELKKMVFNNTILVWRKGLKDWVNIIDLPELKYFNPLEKFTTCKI